MKIRLERSTLVFTTNQSNATFYFVCGNNGFPFPNEKRIEFEGWLANENGEFEIDYFEGNPFPQNITEISLEVQIDGTDDEEFQAMMNLMMEKTNRLGKNWRLYLKDQVLRKKKHLR